MATNSPHARVLGLLLGFPAAACFAQDVTFGSMEAHTSTEQTSSSTTTSSDSSIGQVQDGAASSDQNGDSAFGNFGSLNQQSSSSGSSHSESRSESKGIGVEIGMGDDDQDDWPHAHDHGHHHGGPPDWGTALVGRWTLGQENGATCTIELKDNEWFGGHGAYVPAGCPDGFFPANRWVLSGNQLLITDTSNTTIGRFRQNGGGRWSGRRESDGARLYLNPAGN